jgi:dienelactone hydrolase
MPAQPPSSRRTFLRQSGLALLAGFSAGRSALAAEKEIVTVHDWIRQQAREAPLRMRFEGTTAAEARKWQEAFASKLRSLLGPHEPPTKWETKVEERTDLKDHRREMLLLTAPDHPPLPVYLLTPLGKSDRPRPGILALHGHGAHGYHPVAGRDDLPGVARAIASANYDYGRQLVRKGYVVAAPCLSPFGRRLGDREAYGKQDPCAIAFLRLQLLGKLLIAENLRDALWALELLVHNKGVDASRLGCVGLSYGGRMTMLTSALEPRLGVAVVSGALNVMQERIAQRYSCGAQIIPGLLEYGDVPEIGGLIAPRPCVWEVGSHDGLIKPDWAKEALKRMGRVYRALGAEQNLLVDRFEGGHRWNGVVAYPLLEKVLKPSG